MARAGNQPGQAISDEAEREVTFESACDGEKFFVKSAAATIPEHGRDRDAVRSIFAEPVGGPLDA